MKGFFVFGTPVISLSINGKKFDALLDTGFNGQLMLPQHLIDIFKLQHLGITDYITASGDGKITNVYMATLLFHEEKRKVIVLATEADLSLAGMELFADSKIIIDPAKNIVEVTKTA